MVSARAVLHNRTLTTAEINKEFEWQQGAGATASAVKKFKEDVSSSPPYLLVFAFMMEGSPFLHILHSVAKFGDSINNKICGFVGDRTNDNKPYPVQLQPDNAWTWKDVEVYTEVDTTSSW